MTVALIAITVCSLAFAAYVYFTHDKIAERKAESYLAKWKTKEEKIIREDAYQRSRAVSLEKQLNIMSPLWKIFQ